MIFTLGERQGVSPPCCFFVLVDVSAFQALKQESQSIRGLTTPAEVMPALRA